MMFKNINCIKFKRGGCCRDKRIRRSFWIIGARVCPLYYNPLKDCKFQEKSSRRPIGPPPQGVPNGK